TMVMSGRLMAKSEMYMRGSGLRRSVPGGVARLVRRHADLERGAGGDAQRRAGQHGVAGLEAREDLDEPRRVIARADGHVDALGDAVLEAQRDGRESALVDRRRRHREHVTALARDAPAREEPGDEAMTGVRDAHEE